MPPPLADVVVFALHSSGLSGRQWARLPRALGAGATVFAPDFLGYGDAPRVAHEAAFDFHDDVARIAAMLPSEGRVHLVGHSYGALCALVLAREHPERVASLTLYEPVAFGVLYDAGDREGLDDLARVDDEAFSRDEGGGDEAWLRSFVDYWNARGAWDALPASTRETFRATGRKQFQEVRSLMRDRTPAWAYRALPMPALFLCGARSPIASRRTSALLAEAMPLGSCVEIAGAGHMGPLTHGEQVNALIAAHLAKVST